MKIVKCDVCDHRLFDVIYGEKYITITIKCLKCKQIVIIKIKADKSKD